MCKGIDTAYGEMFVRNQIITVNTLFNWIEKERQGLFPQFLSLLVTVNDLPLGAILYFLAQPHVFQTGDAKRNASV